MILLCALVVGSNAWADETILTLDCATPAPTGTSTALSTTTDVATFLNSAAGLSEAVNKITCGAKDGDVYKGKGTGGGNIPQQCLKVGKASAGGSFTFTIPSTYDNVDVVELTCYGWKTTSSISINNGTAQTFTTAQAEATKTFELASGTKNITIAVTTSAVCITEIVLKKKTTAAVATPTFSPAAGTYTSTQSVALSCATSGATIYYTLDGTTPTSSSDVYSSAISVSATKTIKAIAKKGEDYSNVASAAYNILPVTHAGTALSPYTVTDARNALAAEIIESETDYYASGIIAKIVNFNENTGQLTYWISDDGSMTNSLQCYKGKNVDGANFTGASDLEVGDIVTVKGKLKIYSATYEFDENNEVVTLTQRTKVNIATFTATTTDLTIGSTTTTTTSVTNDQVGWTPVAYTYSSDNEAVATVAENGVVTAVAKGTANITVIANVAANNATYKVGTSKSIAITVHTPSHTARFSVNGDIDDGDNDVAEEGDAITFPTDPAAVGGKTFVGWTTTAINVATDNVPALYTSATMGNSDITYYAVFASSEEGEGWLKMAASDISEAGTYALLTTDGHAFKGSISSSGHGEATDDAFSFVKNTAASAPTGTCEITLTVSGSGFTMYNATNKYLYASKAASGGLAWHDSEDSYWLYANDNWQYSKDYSGSYARLRSYSNNSFRTYSTNSGDVLVFAKKTNVTVYSGFFTSIPDEPSTPVVSGTTVTLATSANMAGWRTYNNNTDKKYTVDGTTKVYYASATGSSTVTLEEIAGGVPANTAVILHQTSGTSITLTETDATITAPGSSNKLAVSTVNQNLGKVFRLGYKSSDGIGFYSYTTTSAPAGIIYVSSITAGAREFLGFDFGDETTGVNEVKTQKVDGQYFNLAGQRVAQPTKGLYIVNGKKVIIK